MTKAERSEHNRMIDAELAKLIAEANHLTSATAKINRETVLYPIALTSGVLIGMAAVMKLFL